MTSLSNSELGDLGESELKTLAQRARMTPSPPDKDRKGWDFFLEWEIDSVKSRVPLDRDHREVKALVQVKTSMGHPGSWSVKLTNWKSLVEYGGPSFFVGVEMEEAEAGLEVAHLYVVHVGEELIKRYLKRLRKLDSEMARQGNTATSGEGETGSVDIENMPDRASVEPPKLHKRTMTVSFDEHALSSPTARRLREAFEVPLERNPQAYVERKRRLISSIGYEEDGFRRLSGTMKFHAPQAYRDDPHGHLADVALGEAEPLEITGGEIRDVRFGIASSPRAVGRGQMPLQAPKAPVRLRFKREDDD